MNRAAQTRSRECGLTILELAFSLLVLTVCGSVIAMSIGTGFGVWRDSGANRELSRKATRGLTQLVEEIRRADGDSILPDLQPDQSSDYISFQAVAGYLSGQKVLGETTRIEWQPDPEDPEDGTDNNGNGAIDEGLILLRRSPGEAGEKRIVIARGVANLLCGEEQNGSDDNGNGLVDEKGLCFEREDGMLRIRVTFLLPGRDGEPLTTTGEQTVAVKGWSQP